MIIKLSVFERITCLGSMLPMDKAESYYNLKYLRELRESISLDSEEYKLFKPHVLNETERGLHARWDEIHKAIPEKEIEFAEWLFDEIRDKLKKASDSKPPTLTDDKLALYEKFVLSDIER